MDQSDSYFLKRISQRARNAIDSYLFERERDVRYALSAKRYAEGASQEYGDRFLVELIQNAYDAHPRHSKGGCVAVTLDRADGECGTLYVANTGRPFTDANFQAITSIAQSDKPPGEGIGNKGIGFKSVLQVTDYPEVYSADPQHHEDPERYGYCFRLPTKADVAAMVAERDLDDVLREVPPHSLPIPIPKHSIPPHVRSFRREGFCTVVRLPLETDDACERAEAAIQDLAEAATPLLLFLDRIVSLDLCINDADHSTVLYERLVRTSRSISPSSGTASLLIEEVELGEQGSFIVASRTVAATDLNRAVADSVPGIDRRWTAEPLTEDANVAIAARLQQGESDWHFYTYLPMDEAHTPFAAHANAPFFTKIDRNKARFDLPYNGFLLDEVASLCAETAFWIRDNAPNYAPVCLDLICWDRSHLGRLVNAFEKLGTNLADSELVPCVSVGDDLAFSSVEDARCWGPFATEMKVVTPQLLTQVAGAQMIDPLWEQRVERFRELRAHLSPTYDDASPGDEELAEWLEAVAKKLGSARPRTSGEVWMDFYEDIARAFQGRDGSVLRGRKLVIDNRNRLLRCGHSEEESPGPVVFFSRKKSNSNTQDDSSSLDAKLPPSLSKAVAFTRGDLLWHTKSGSTNAARKFFDDQGLIREYETAEVLEVVGRFVNAARKSSEESGAAEAQSALEFAFELRDRLSDETLRAAKLSVPTRGGWHLAEQASFSEGWTDLGRSLEALVQLAAATSPALAEQAERLLLAPRGWLPEGASESEWRSFLRKLGVRDGLHPTSIPRAKFKAVGRYFTAYSWAMKVKLKPEFASAWTASVGGAASLRQRTQYESTSQLWMLPGQFEYDELPPEAKERYADLIISSFETWPSACLTVAIRREGHPDEPPTYWPTPLHVFLRGAAWVPVKIRNGIDRVVPAAAWYFEGEHSASLPNFAPIVRLRNAIQERIGVRDRLQSWCGVRSWNDPRDAARLSKLMFTLLAEGRVSLSDMTLLQREYQGAVNRSFKEAEDPWSVDENAWSDDPEPGVVVRRGQFLEAVKITEGCGPLYLADAATPSTLKLLEKLAAPIVCALPADGPRILSALEPSAPGELRLLSDVPVEVEVDGTSLSEATSKIALITPATEWLVDLVLAALEYRSNRIPAYQEAELRDKARRLRQLKLVPARRIRVAVDGRPIDLAGSTGAITVLDSVPPLIVLDWRGDEIRWETLEQVAHPIAEAVGASELGSVLFEAIVKLERYQFDDARIAATLEACAQALGITTRQIEDLGAMVRSSLDILRDRIPVAVACLFSVDAGKEIETHVSNARNEGDVAAALEKCGIGDPQALMERVKTADDLAELRDSLGRTYAEFNTVLTALGRSNLADPVRHSQLFDYFVQRHRDAIIRRLRQPASSGFLAGVRLSGYLESLRELNQLGADPAWLAEYEYPTEEVMAERVDQWLNQQRAPTLDVEVGDDPRSGFDAFRAANRRALTAAGEDLGRLVRAWCAKSERICPEIWLGDGCGGRLADWADDEGLLDFIDLKNIQPLTAHLIRDGKWPEGMPRALTPEGLGLSDDDIRRGESERERQRAEQRLARSTVMVGERRFGVEPEDFAEIAAAVDEGISKEFLETPFRIELGPAPANAASGRQHSGEKSFYRNEIPFSEGQRRVIGLAAEQRALRWLEAQAQYSDALVRWRSGYSDKVQGGGAGDDTLGYDIEVITSSNRFLFEVKGTADDRQEFELTHREMEVASENRSRNAWRVIFVNYALDDSLARPRLLPNPFSQRGAEAYSKEGTGVRYRFS